MLRFVKKITERLGEYEARLNDRTKAADKELAELTGLNRVTVTRALKKLREGGRIKTDSGIEIL